MISSIRGKLKHKQSDRVVVDVGGIGYDIYLPQFVMRGLESTPDGDPIEFNIYYHVTDRQLRPILIGFNNEFEKRFFEKFISVEDIGPLKAAKAMVLSVSAIAGAIEADDIGVLRSLPGIGERTARKMVATLRGKVTEEALLLDAGYATVPTGAPRQVRSQLSEDGIDILVNLGHRRSEAAVKIEAALKRSPELVTPEELIREVYRGERGEGT